MFENYEAAKHRRAPKWAMPLLVAGLIIHAAMLMAMWIKSIWATEKLELPKGRISLGGFAPPPPPPPPPPGGKKPEEKKLEPKKKKVTDTVQPVKEPEKIVDTAPSGGDESPDGEEGGVEGGVAGGVTGGVVSAPPPPPPPPPPAPPQNVAPTALEQQRVSGEKQISPDDVTKTEIGRSGKTKLVASFKICLATSGAISNITMLKSSGFPAYDQKLTREMRSTWKYRPFMVNGKAAPVCTAVTFIYSQKS
jgi:periplasmic protein TonB